MPYKNVLNEVRLWKYLDEFKLTWLLENRALYLPRPCKFEDPWEGRLPRSESQEERAERISEMQKMGLLPATGPDAEQALDTMDSADLWFDRNRYIGCWHMNDGESAAMWDLYCSRDAGIALTTTGKRLNDIAESLEGAVFAQVEYLDYERDSVLKAGRDRSLCKRRSFSHEQEARLVLTPELEKVNAQSLAVKSYQSVPIDPSSFIDAVYISPTAPKDFVNRINEQVRRAIPHCQVQQSDLYTPY